MANIYDDLAEAAAKAQDELSRFGAVTGDTQVKLAQAQAGVALFEKKLGLVGNTLSNTVGIFTSYNKEIYRGASAAQALNAGIDSMADAVKNATAFLALLVPGGVLVRGLVAGIGLLTGELMKAGKEINTHAGTVFKAFQEAAAAGAAGAGGMKDVFDGLMKVGLGTDKFNHYLKMVNENAGVLSLFGNTVYEGRHKFEQTMEQLEPFRVQLQQMGLDREKQADATMSYIRVMRMSSLATRDNMKASGEAVAKYIKETDALARITGINREKQEDIMRQAMRREQFAATIYRLESEGNTNAANMYRKGLILASKAGGDVADQYMDSVSRFGLTTEMAAKGFRATGGELQNFTQSIMSGRIATDEDLVAGFEKLGQRTKSVYNAFQGLGEMGVLNEFGGSIEGITGLINLTGTDMRAALRQGEEERRRQLGDPTTEKMAKAQENVARTQIAQQRLLNTGTDIAVDAIYAASKANRELAESALAAAESLNKISGRTPPPAAAPAGGGTPGTARGRVTVPMTDNQFRETTKGGTAGPGAAPKTSMGMGATIGQGPLPGGPASVAQLDKIKAMIGKAESYGGDYNAIAGQARGNYDLVNKTIGEIKRLSQTYGGSGAAGKYQVIPTTLSDAQRALGLRDTDKFDESTQERIGEWLIRTRGGYDTYLKNPTQEGKERLLMSLANIWRGLPNTPGTKASAPTDQYKNRAGFGWDEAMQMFADGGKLGAGRQGIAGEAGPELITGPANITPMNDLMGAFSNLLEVMERSSITLERIDRNTSSAADTSDRMLRLSMN